MNIQDLKQKLADYSVHALYTKKTCEVCEANKAEFYVEWEFPHFRDYFCLSCAVEASPEKEPELLLSRLRVSYKKNFQNGKSDQCFMLWIEGSLQNA